MPRRNTLFFIIVLIIFALALSYVLPINKGLLGSKGIRLGLDLQGGLGEGGVGPVYWAEAGSGG